mgnify:CR=1 FL=1
MISAQDIREKGFDKVRKDGYDMESVDDFLEEVADSISAYQKENAVLKSKMKVLVDKIEEYRTNEEALNQAILSAQKLAVQIENDARSRSAEMLSDAEQKVQEIIGGITEQTAIEEKKLADAKASADKFIDGIRAMCSAQLKNLDNIALGSASRPAAPAEKLAPDEQEDDGEDVDDTVRTIEKSVSRIKPEPDVKFDLSSAMKAPSKQKKNFDNTQPFTI